LAVADPVLGYETRTDQTLLAGSASDARAQAAVAALIEEATSLLRSSSRTRDYFSGYTLAEVLKERIDQIGADPSLDDDPNVFLTGRRTLLARLNYVKELLIGADGNGGALAIAEKFNKTGLTGLDQYKA